MTSGGNILIIFNVNQLAKFSAV